MSETTPEFELQPFEAVQLSEHVWKPEPVETFAVTETW